MGLPGTHQNLVGLTIFKSGESRDSPFQNPSENPDFYQTDGRTYTINYRQTFTSVFDYHYGNLLKNPKKIQLIIFTYTLILCRDNHFGLQNWEILSYFSKKSY